MNPIASPESPPSRVVAGYRLVRKIADGSRAEVFLAVSDDKTVVMKVYRPEVPREAINAELEAICRGPAEHRVRLLDVGTGDDGVPVAVLERVPGGSLGQLLSRRSGLEAGEAVTIVAPLARLVAGLHAGGVAHRAIGVNSVHFGEAGQPILLAFGAAEVFPAGQPPAGLDLQPGVIVDRERLAGLASLVIESVRTGARTAVLERTADWLSARTPPLGGFFVRELEERLFDAAEATPVGLATQPVGALPGVVGTTPVGAALVTIPARTPVARRGEPRGNSRHAATRVHRLPRARVPRPNRTVLLASMVGAAPLEAVRARAMASLRAVRWPVWAVAGGVAVALAAALVLVPGGDGRPAPVGTPTPPMSPSQRTPPVPEATDGIGAVTARPIGSGDRESAAVTGDDPAAALGPLLTARARCFDELSAACLTVVDQPGSVALANDTALIEGTAVDGWAPAPGTAARKPRVLDREGDTALVRFGAHSKPASVLMIRNEAGWRIRSFMEP